VMVRGRVPCQDCLTISGVERRVHRAKHNRLMGREGGNCEEKKTSSPGGKQRIG